MPNTAATLRSIADTLEACIEPHESPSDALPIIRAAVDEHGDLREDALAEGRAVSLPYFTKALSGKRGRVPRQCTHDYKTAVVRRVARRLGGGPHRHHRPVVMVLGISWDEFERMSDSDVQYVTHEYPLIDKRWTRADCLRYARERWQVRAPRSACVGCPKHGDGWWRAIDDEELADAAEFERTLQATTALDDVPYLHRTLRPIEVVVRDLRAQGQLFGDDLSLECGASCHT